VSSDVTGRLRELADAATPGPWRIDPMFKRSIYGQHRVVATAEKVAKGREDARLIALAPALARGYADALDALAELRGLGDCWCEAGAHREYRPHSDACEATRALLADAGRLLGDNT